MLRVVQDKKWGSGPWNGLPHSAAFTTKLGQHLGRPVSEAEKGSHWPPQVSQAQTVLPPRPLQRRSREGRRGGKRLIAAQVKVQSLLGVGAARPGPPRHFWTPKSGRVCFLHRPGQMPEPE